MIFMRFGRLNTPLSFSTMPQRTKYNCSDYREEMRLLSLKKRLDDKNLSESEKRIVKAEIAKLEKALQLN